MARFVQIERAALRKLEQLDLAEVIEDMRAPRSRAKDRRGRVPIWPTFMSARLSSRISAARQLWGDFIKGKNNASAAALLLRKISQHHAPQIGGE
ncbi:MAG: hypothetical protein AB1479_02325 [Pseudomonadota bacterium]